MEFTKIERHWDVYHKTPSGTKGTFSHHHSYKVDGLADPVTKEILIKKSLDDKNAAATCFHEVTHQDQPLTMDLLKAEYDAFIQEEYFHMRHGISEIFPSTRIKASTTFVADVAKIKKEVKDLYKHRDPSIPFIYEFDKEVPSGVNQVKTWVCPPAPAGITPLSTKPPKAKIKAGKNPKLRAIRTSGPKKGHIYLTSRSITAGTQVTLLQENIPRIDWDKKTKTMTEILYNFRNYWILHSEIDYTP